MPVHHVRSVCLGLPAAIIVLGAASAAPREIWRWLVLAMLAFLTGEAVLTLPTLAQLKRWDLVPGERQEFGKEKPVAGGPV